MLPELAIYASGHEERSRKRGRDAEPKAQGLKKRWGGPSGTSPTTKEPHGARAKAASNGHRRGEAMLRFAEAQTFTGAPCSFLLTADSGNGTRETLGFFSCCSIFVTAAPGRKQQIQTQLKATPLSNVSKAISLGVSLRVSWTKALGFSHGKSNSFRPKCPYLVCRDSMKAETLALKKETFRCRPKQQMASGLKPSCAERRWNRGPLRFRSCGLNTRWHMN